jgi:hypothetical protein
VVLVLAVRAVTLVRARRRRRIQSPGVRPVVPTG